MHSASAPLVFERSIGRTALLLAWVIVLTAVSWFCFSSGILRFAWEAWLLGMFLGPIGVVIQAVSLFRGGPQVAFDEDGIHDFRTSWGPIAWREIRSLEIVTYYASPHLCIFLWDESGRAARLSLWGKLAIGLNRVTGYPLLMLRFNGLTPGMKEAWEYIQSRHLEKILATLRPPE